MPFDLRTGTRLELIARFQRLILILICCCLFASREVQAQRGAPPKRFLFIGNSYTIGDAGRGDPELPGRFKQMCELYAHPVTVDVALRNGATLQQHLDRGDVARLIQQGNYDFVVLQAQSLETIQAPERFHQAIAGFKQLVQGQQTRLCLFMTWARQHTPEQITTIAHEYEQAARTHDAILIPCGWAWEYCRQRLPEVQLYKQDESHPRTAGTYLNVCVFFQTFWGDIPAKPQFAYRGKSAYLTGTLAQELQAIAAAATRRASALRTLPDVAWHEENTWAFAGKPEEPWEQQERKRLLDLRSLNEDRSGATGFVRLSPDGQSFVRGDGQPIRFWAVGSDLYRRSEDEMRQHCRFLARIGVNMVRLHTTVAATREGSAITDVNEREIDGIFRFIRAAKEAGIYITLSPYYGHHDTPASWQLAGYSESQAKPWGAIFIDGRMQQAYRQWTRELYTRVNPYTGLAIKNDPTVAILQIHNEDSVFFWTFGKIPAVQKQQLGRRFHTWLAARHGDSEAATSRWKGAQAEGDDFEQGVVGLLGPYHMTQSWDGGMAVRVQDEVEFLARLQRQFYQEMGNYLRHDLGCQQLLNATNWRTANDERLKDLERWTYAALDIDAENEYYGSDYQHLGDNSNYRIDPGHLFVNESCLHKPLELTTHFKQHVGHPFLVTETSWKNPNLFQSEGPFLVAAYQSLGGVDAVYWFSAQEPTWNLDPRRDFWKVGDSYAYHKWSCSNPLLMGMFPAASLIYRRHDLQAGSPVVQETRSLSDLFLRRPAVIDDNEIYGVSREINELALPRRPDGRISRAAYLVGPVQWQVGEASPAQLEPDSEVVDPRESPDSELAAANMSSYLRPLEGEVASNTGQLVWNYRQGTCTLDAPRAQGVCGFLQAAGGHFQLSNIKVTSSNAYATVFVVSLDGRPLESSDKVLVQVGTIARLSGWKQSPATIPFKGDSIAGYRIDHTGSPPWRIENTAVRLGLTTDRIRYAYRVDADGYATSEVKLVNNGDQVSMELPGNSMYVVMTSRPISTK